LVTCPEFLLVVTERWTCLCLERTTGVAVDELENPPWPGEADTGMSQGRSHGTLTTCINIVTFTAADRGGLFPASAPSTRLARVV
jgi:hypothetical protein